MVALRAQEPYKDARKTPATFNGPLRDAPEPNVSEVLFGWFGPAEGPMWEAASRAIADANRAGGYHGLPFRLVTGWASDPWRAGARHLTRMVFKDGVWAVIPAANGDAAHLAEQVAAKASLPLVNPVATDRSLHGAGVPWMFSCVQGDDAIARVVAEAAPVAAVVSSTDHDSRAFLGKLKPLIRVTQEIEFEPGRPELAAGARGETVIVVANAADSVGAVLALRAAGFRGRIVGGPNMGRARVTGIEYPDIADAAACAYDSAGLLVAAVRAAGLNRSRIRDALADLSPYDGTSGRIEFDTTGQNRRAVKMASR